MVYRDCFITADGDLRPGGDRHVLPAEKGGEEEELGLFRHGIEELSNAPRPRSNLLLREDSDFCVEIQGNGFLGRKWMFFPPFATVAENEVQ